MKPPIALWYGLALALIALGSFFSYAGAKLILAHLQVELAGALGLFGIVLALWGAGVLVRCLRTR